LFLLQMHGIFFPLLFTTYYGELNYGASRLSPVDTIITRMGAYDNMFSNASTFKVELDEW
jgi:hypothetical protein